MFETPLSTLDLVVAVILEGYKIVSNSGEFLGNIVELSSTLNI